MWHSTAMVADYDRAIERLQTIGGLRLLEYSESTQPEVGRRGGMTWIGDNSIELGQPIVEGAGAAKFVARSGGGMHSIAVQVRDLDATMAHLESCGVKIAARPAPEFCFSDPRDTDGVFFEWGVHELDIDPRFDHEIPPMVKEPVLDVATQAFIGAVVDDPVASADKFARLLGTDVTFEDAGASPGSPRVGVSLGDCTLALYAMPGDESAALWGRQYDRARTHLMALGVSDVDSAGAVLDDAR